MSEHKLPIIQDPRPQAGRHTHDSDERLPFPEGVARALADERLQAALYKATSAKRAVRAEALSKLEHAAELRDLAATIKQHTLDHLDVYLERFVDRFEANGGHAHFARTAEEARQIICDIAAKHQSRLCVKAKSMATEEIEINGALQAAGVEVVETDLGEFIVQIDHDRPSHIVTPIIHKDRRTIAEAFTRELGTAYTEDPVELTQLARTHLRDIFRRCDLGITGVNFAVAETGTLCLCTNEGNGRLTVTRPRVHVALMGIEKVIPRLMDLSVFLKLLARSGTGQPMTCYTSMIHGPRQADDLDGPEEVHVVILDAGRSDILASEHRAGLRCIRCGACLNACPVFSKIGGHAYGSVYPGPIGKLITPLLAEVEAYDDLPQVSSLCGLCREVCPVGIDIPGLLVRLRRDQVSQRVVTRGHRLGFRVATFLLNGRLRYQAAQWFARLALRPPWRRARSANYVERVPGPLHTLTDRRDLRVPAKKSFRTIWEEGLEHE
jgi:L-lactate dehydrogenase complex protein LldF